MFFCARKEVINIVVEELDIIVQASVEQALTEFKKIVPQLKKTIQQVENGLNNVDTKRMTNKVQQAVQQVKQKISEVKNTGVDKQLQSQFNKAGASVQKYEGQLDQLNQKLRKVYAEMDNIQANTWKEYTPEGVELGNKAIEPTVSNALSDNKQYQNLTRQAAKLEEQIVSLNAKLNTTKQQYGQIAGQIQQTTVKQSTWNNMINKAKSAIDNVKKSAKSIGDNFKNVSDITERVRSGCTQILNVTTKVSSRVKQIGAGFKQGLKHVLRYAVALISLESIYGTLSSSANAWLSSQNAGAMQLQANIDYLKYGFGSSLAPVIQYIVNLIYQLMKAIQSVVYALSGVNIFANASAKAYSSMASSAKEANKQTKQLAGVHSEINNISSNDSNSDGSGGGSTAPSFDLSQIDSQMSPLAQKLYDFFKPLVDSWNTYGASLVEQVKKTASQIGSLLSTVWGSFEKIITNGTVYSILENILAIIGNIAQAWSNAWQYNGNGDAIVQNLADAFNNLLMAINNVVQSPAFQEWLNNCSDKFREISEKIASINWQPLVDALMQIGTSIGTLALNILSGLVDVFKWLVENPAVAEIILAIAVAISVVSTVMGVLSGVMTTLTAVSTALNISMLPLTGIILAIIAVIALIVVAIMNWDSIMQALAATWQAVYQTISSVIDWIVEKVTYLWSQISWIFEAIWEVISTVFGFIWDIVSTVFNAIWNIVSPILNAVWSLVSTIFGAIWNIISSILGSVWNIFSQIFNWIWQLVSKVFGAIWNVISPIMTKIWDVIKSVLNKIKEIWSNIWNTISNVVTSIWNGIWSAIKTVINAILGGIESFVNGIINGINWVLSGISSVANAIGGLIGLDPINLRINTISLPRLAKGAVLKVPTVAEMAEYPGASTNPEIVTPQNIMEETFDRVLARYQNEDTTPIYLTVNVGNTKLGQILLDDLRKMKRRSGKDIEALVGG